MSSALKFGGLFLIFAAIIGVSVYIMEDTRVKALQKVADDEKAYEERTKNGGTPVVATTLKKVQAPGVGDTALEIKMSSWDGKEYSLESLRGKYVLLDFWASWCGPCRKENPSIVKTYQKYKTLLVKGQYEFTVFSVSLDTKIDAWKSAVVKDQLEWPYHVSHLASWSCKTAEAYGVEQIPANFLIDPQGKIVRVNLRGDELDKALAEIN